MPSKITSTVTNETAGILQMSLIAEKRKRIALEIIRVVHEVDEGMRMGGKQCKQNVGDSTRHMNAAGMLTDAALN